VLSLVDHKLYIYTASSLSPLDQICITIRAIASAVYSQWALIMPSLSLHMLLSHCAVTELNEKRVFFFYYYYRDARGGSNAKSFSKREKN
jgi:hypothetical protein